MYNIQHSVHSGELSTPRLTAGRDSLLLIPSTSPSLGAVLSYYRSTLKMSADGDISVEHEQNNHIGRVAGFLRTWAPFLARTTQPVGSRAAVQLDGFVFLDRLQSSWWEDVAAAGGVAVVALYSAEDWPVSRLSSLRLLLIQSLPPPGYFLAGGTAGIVSRTVTAPLDRLKVYLIAQTGSAKGAASAKQAAGAIPQAVNPLFAACKELWKAGGVRSLFAGECAAA